MINKLKTMCAQQYAQRVSAIDEKIAEYRADNRIDEIKLLKASRNIYEIYTQMLGVAEKPAKGDYKEYIKTYIGLLFKMPKEWQAARIKANEHADTARVALEDAKINAAADIAMLFSDSVRALGEG